MAVSLDYSQFHEVFKPDVDTPYDQHLVKDIEAKRKRLYGLLFVDRILKALGHYEGYDFLSALGNEMCRES